MHILRMSKEDISDISKIRNARNIPFVVFRESFWCSILMSQEQDQDYSLSGEVSRYKGGQKILGRLISLTGVSVSLISTASPPSFAPSVGLEYVSPSSTSAAVKFPFIFAHREISLAFSRKSERERVRPLVFSFYSSAVLLLPPETSRSPIDRRPFSAWYKNMGE